MKYGESYNQQEFINDLSCAFTTDNPRTFGDILKKLPNDNERIGLVKNSGFDFLETMIGIHYKREFLYQFLNSIESYDKKLEIIDEICNNYRYKTVFPIKILDFLKPEDSINLIKNKNHEKKIELLKSFSYNYLKEENKAQIKEIFFDEEDVDNKKFDLIYNAHINFSILSTLASKDNFGFESHDVNKLFITHLSKIKEKLPHNQLPNIYQELFDKLDSDSAIDLKDNNKLFLRRSELKKHSSYFIFHVNAQNKLTKISYCDGNKVSDQRSIIGSRTHINSITNYELANPIDFSAEFADKFIKENSQKEDIIDFYNKISAENFKFKGLEETSISSITYEMPREEQKRGNCAMKSANILACAILQLKDPSQEFIWDKKAKKPAGKGYENYKEFKNTLSKLALEELEMVMPEIQKIKPKKDGYKRELFEVMEEVFLKRIELAKDHFSDKVKKKSKEYSTSTPSCFSFLSCIGKFFSKKKM